MATSNSTNFNQTTQEIIQLALFHVGKYGMGRSPSVEDFNIAKRILNSMMKSWSAQGLHLWAKEEGLLFLDQYVGEYSLNNTSSDARFTTKADAVTAEISTTVSSGTSLTVNSTTGMAVSDTIGIVLDDGSTTWTTVATIPTSTTLTINAALTSQASQGNLVYCYTERAAKPLRILDARLLQGFDAGSTSDQIEIPMNPISYQDYWRMAATTYSGAIPNQFHYNPKVNNGMLYIWPRPSNTSYRMQMSYERVLQDLDNLNDDFDLPPEWFEALQWQLAIRLAPGMGAKDRLPEIGKIGAEALRAIMDWDNEITSVYFQPNMGYIE